MKRTGLCTRSRTQVRTYTRACTHTHIHVHVHTHTQARLSPSGSERFSRNSTRSNEMLRGSQTCRPSSGLYTRLTMCTWSIGYLGEHHQYKKNLTKERNHELILILLRAMMTMMMSVPTMMMSVMTKMMSVTTMMISTTTMMPIATTDEQQIKGPTQDRSTATMDVTDTYDGRDGHIYDGP